MTIAATNSHPRIHTTGPVHHFVRVPPDPADGTPAVVYYYLGTCQTNPVIRIRKNRLNVMNDLGGRVVPFQELEQGESASISLLLNRFSNTAYSSLMTLPQGTWSSESPGVETRYHRGQLTYGLHTFGLYQIFDWYGQSFPGADQIIQGYYWPTCEIVDHDTHIVHALYCHEVRSPVIGIPSSPR